MNRLLTDHVLAAYGVGAVVALGGLVVVLALWRRIGWAARLAAGGGLVVLGAGFAGALVWSLRVGESTFLYVDLGARWGFEALWVVGFALLAVAVVVGRRSE